MPSTQNHNPANQNQAAIAYYEDLKKHWTPTQLSNLITLTDSLGMTPQEYIADIMDS